VKNIEFGRQTFCVGVMTEENSLLMAPVPVI